MLTTWRSFELFSFPRGTEDVGTFYLYDPILLQDLKPYSSGLRRSSSPFLTLENAVRTLISFHDLAELLDFDRRQALLRTKSLHTLDEAKT